MSRERPPQSRMQDLLMTAMEDRLYEEGHDRDELAASMQARGGTDASLSRLVNGKARAPRQGLDAVVDAYAAVIGCDPLELWTDALARWVKARPAEDAWVEQWREQHAKELRHRTAELGRAAKAAKARLVRSDRMWGDLVDVSGLAADALTQRRQQLRLSKAETARGMYAALESSGPGSLSGVTLTGSGSAWATESACRRAIDDLEGGRRQFKEAHYVEALLEVLGLQPQDVGLSGLA